MGQSRGAGDSIHPRSHDPHICSAQKEDIELGNEPSLDSSAKIETSNASSTLTSTSIVPLLYMAQLSSLSRSFTSTARAARIAIISSFKSSHVALI